MSTTSVTPQPGRASARRFVSLAALAAITAIAPVLLAPPAAAAGIAGSSAAIADGTTAVSPKIVKPGVPGDRGPGIVPQDIIWW